MKQGNRRRLHAGYIIITSCCVYENVALHCTTMKEAMEKKEMDKVNQGGGWGGRESG